MWIFQLVERAWYSLPTDVCFLPGRGYVLFVTGTEPISFEILPEYEIITQFQYNAVHTKYARHE